MSEALDTNAKALKINLDPVAYGTFAEIGGGQEASRWFFRVGGAAGTVAKTMSAYDMAVSDAIYGAGERYVSRERVRSMLKHEYDLLVERLGPSRGDKTAFFAFADTVATRSFKGGNECHGWIGLRFQHEPGAPPSDVLLHTALRDPTAQQQQQTLGIIGVNLIFGVYYLRQSFTGMLRSLMDGLSLENIEIDVVDCSGPAFSGKQDQRATALDMLDLGLTQVVVFDDSGVMEQPSTVFRKHALLVHRCSPRGENPEMARMFEGSVDMLAAEGPDGASERGPLRLLEMSVRSAGPVAPDAPAAAASIADLRPAVDRLFRPGHAVMLTGFPETFRLSTYLRRYSTDPIRFIVGIDAIVTIFRAHFYRQIDGGLLEGLGRLLAPKTRFYAFPMPAAVLRRRLQQHEVEPEFWSAPDKPVLAADDLTIAPPAGHLLAFLRSAGWLVAAPVQAGAR